MVSNKPKKLQARYWVKYCLKGISSHPKSIEVASVRCRFCAAFGREEMVGG